MKIAFPTNDKRGLEDKISDVFAKSETFTIIDYDDKNKEICNVSIIYNEAKNFSHGSGPVAIKILMDRGVSIVATADIGVGSKELLKEKGIRLIKIKSGITVQKALETVLKEITSK